MAFTSPPREIGLSDCNRVGIAPDATGEPMICYAGSHKTLALLSGLPGAQRWPEWDCIAFPMNRTNILVCETVGRVEEATEEYVAERNRLLAAPMKYADQYPPAPVGEPEPYRHQMEAFCHAESGRERGLNGFGQFSEMGMGKSRWACDFLRAHVLRAGVVLCQNSTSLQWKQWLERICPEMEVRMLTGISLIRRMKLIQEVTAGQRLFDGPVVFVLNWEVLARLLPELVKLRPDVVIADECFLAGTPVDTPRGVVPIEKLRTGDPVYSALGEDQVIGISKREVDAIAIVQFEQNKVVCSTTHLWLTKDGWKKSSELKEGDYLVQRSAAMRVLREANGTRSLGEKESSQASLLQRALLCQMEDAAARNQTTDFHARKKPEPLNRYKELVRKWLSRGRKSQRTNSHDASSPHGRIQSQDLGTSQRNRTQTRSSRREWKRINGSAKTVVRCLGSWLGSRMDRPDQSRGRRVSGSLQDRYRESTSFSRDRDRWTKSQFSEPSRFRPEEGKETVGIRVDSVEIYKSGSPEFYQYSNSKNTLTLYDIEVKRHPSFCIHGVVVHNCTRIKERNAQMSKAAHKLGEVSRYRVAMTGTPMGNQPGDLWSIFRFIEPSLFGKSYWNFVNNYFLQGGFTGREFVGFNPLQIGSFIGRLYANSYRITKATCPDLPEKSFETVTLEMEGEQASLYRQLEKDLYAKRVKDDGTVERLSVPNALVQILRLQQITAGLFPVESEDSDGAQCQSIESVKTRWLQAYCKETLVSSDAQLVIWCRFRKEIEATCEALAEAGLQPGVDFNFIDGRIKIRDRETLRVAFNDRENPLRVLICQTAAAAYGLDLPAADVLVYATNSFSYLERAQSLERGHRMGRQRPYTVIDLVCKGTVDVKVLGALKRKQDLAEMLLVDGF